MNDKISQIANATEEGSVTPLMVADALAELKSDTNTLSETVNSIANTQANLLRHGLLCSNSWTAIENGEEVEYRFPKATFSSTYAQMEFQYHSSDGSHVGTHKVYLKSATYENMGLMIPRQVKDLDEAVQDIKTIKDAVKKLATKVDILERVVADLTGVADNE